MEYTDKEFVESYDQQDRSMEATRWVPSIMLHRNATEEDVSKLEKRLGIQFPADYRKMLLLHQGHRPWPSKFAFQDVNTNEWHETSMGPLWHCLDDENEILMDYHIASFKPNFKTCKLKQGAKVAISETLAGEPIWLLLPSGIVFVEGNSRSGLAGEDFADFLWRMRLENYRELATKEDGEEEEYYCDKCDSKIEGERWTCKSCEYDICDACHEKTKKCKKRHILNQPGDSAAMAAIFSKFDPYNTVLRPPVHYPVTNPPEVVNQLRKQRAIPFLLPWGDDKYEEFPKLLAVNREISLKMRAEYYTKSGHMDIVSFGWISHILTGRHAVWLPKEEESPDSFAYSIGVWYLHNQPEILLVSEDNSVGSYPLALIVNPIRTAILVDELKVEDGTSFADVIPHVDKDDPKSPWLEYAHCRFEKLDKEGYRKYMGFCTWFNANFLDTMEYPVLVCNLSAKK